MQIIVEIDGVLLNVRPATWEAYSRAVAAVGLARKDEPTAWRLVRTAAADGQFISDARTHQVEKFRQVFDAALDEDDVLAALQPHDDVHETMRTLYDLGPFAGVTCGANLAARLNVLRANSLADAFPKLTQVPAPADAGGSALRAVAASRTDESVVVVLAASVGLIKAADEAGFVPIGIASGAAIAKRLAAAGARATYPGVAEFAAALRNGDESLRRAGLVF